MYKLVPSGPPVDYTMFSLEFLQIKELKTNTIPKCKKHNVILVKTICVGDFLTHCRDQHRTSMARVSTMKVTDT